MHVDKMPLRRPFVPFLIEAVVVDSDDSFQYIMQGAPEDWQVGEDAIFDAARRNALEHFAHGGVERYSR